MEQQQLSCTACDYSIAEAEPQHYVTDSCGNRIAAGDNLISTFSQVYGINPATLNAALQGHSDADGVLQQLMTQLSGQHTVHFCQACANHFQLDLSKDKQACPHCWSQKIEQLTEHHNCPKCSEGQLS